MLLAVGSNNLSTTFDGLLEELSYEVGSEGALKKIGTGELILTNANTYHGSTTVESGTLLANNRPDNGSATGYGSVFVTAGTFGGAGTVTGPVIVGTGRGAGAYLAPGKTDAKPGTLTIQNKVALKSDATYKVTMDSRIPVADKLSCAAASIREAQISFNDIGGSVIASGTIFTVLESTGTDAIAGSFGNLPDGGTIRVGSNTFQADYQDGDGNDLTLTVVK
jgi:autotransporter-associated beta strand protein